MATHAPITGAQTRATTFIAKLLAPLPPDVPQADDARFMRTLKKDAGDVWRHERRAYTVAKARLDYVRAQRLLNRGSDERDAFAALVAEIDRLTAIPTILAEAVTWKRRHLHVGGSREVRERREALIALDVARMERR